MPQNFRFDKESYEMNSRGGVADGGKSKFAESVCTWVGQLQCEIKMPIIAAQLFFFGS